MIAYLSIFLRLAKSSMPDERFGFVADFLRFFGDFLRSTNDCLSEHISETSQEQHASET